MALRGATGDLLPPLAPHPSAGVVVADGVSVSRLVPEPNWWAVLPVGELEGGPAWVHALAVGPGVVLAAARHPDPDRPALTDHNSITRLGTNGWTVAQPPDRLVWALAPLPDGERFVVSECRVGGPGPVRHRLVFRRLSDGAELASQDGPPPSTAGLGRLAVLPDGRVVTAHDSRLAVWDAADPPRLASGDGRAHLRDVVAHPGGRLLAAVRADEVLLFETSSWRAGQAFAPGVGRLTAVACSPDGLLWAAAGKGRVAVWDADG